MPLGLTRIPWRLKSVAFRTLSALPPSVHRWFSRHVTGRSVRDLSNPAYFASLDAHLAALQVTRGASDAILFEFGAGADLLSSQYFSSKGVRRQVVVDLHRNVTPETLNTLVGRAPFVRHQALYTVDFLAELESSGITYLAPYDLRQCELADRSVSFICSTNTLEPIPEPDLQRILAQCRRILRDDGVM